MRKLINVLYSCAAGLEQACLTFETIKQAQKLAATVPQLPAPQVKAPIGFKGSAEFDNPNLDFTAEDS